MYNKCFKSKCCTVKTGHWLNDSFVIHWLAYSLSLLYQYHYNYLNREVIDVTRFICALKRSVNPIHVGAVKNRLSTSRLHNITYNVICLIIARFDFVIFLQGETKISASLLDIYSSWLKWVWFLCRNQTPWLDFFDGVRAKYCFYSCQWLKKEKAAGLGQELQVKRTGKDSS